jgi:hypothetical protein
VDAFADFVSFLGGVSRFGRPADLGVVTTLFLPFGGTLADLSLPSSSSSSDASVCVLCHVLVELLVLQYHYLDLVVQPSFSSTILQQSHH